MRTRTRIVAAAPARVRGLLAAPPRPAAVVHRGADAVYLDLGGYCLGVLSASAVAVPCGLRTALPVLPGDLAGAAFATVGDGAVLLGDTDVVTTRTVDASVPRLPADRVPGALATLERAAGGRLVGVAAELPGDALSRLGQGDPGAVGALLGRGSGLTPVGDDVLAGFVATTVAAGVDTPLADETAARAAAATTLLSATLLDCARHGDVLPQFRRLLLDLAGADREQVGPSVDALLRVGHTSGAGLVLGTTLALRHLATRSSLG